MNWPAADQKSMSKHQLTKSIGLLGLTDRTLVDIAAFGSSDLDSDIDDVSHETPCFQTCHLNSREQI